MSDEPKVLTERDARNRERAAFLAGAAAMWGKDAVPCLDTVRDAYVEVVADAKRRYPLPKVERPRVVRDPHGYGYWKAGRECGRDCLLRSGTDCEDGTWVIAGDYVQISAERVKLWANLLENPTELVEAE